MNLPEEGCVYYQPQCCMNILPEYVHTQDTEMCNHIQRYRRSASFATCFRFQPLKGVSSSSDNWVTVSSAYPYTLHHKILANQFTSIYQNTQSILFFSKYKHFRSNGKVPGFIDSLRSEQALKQAVHVASRLNLSEGEGLLFIWCVLANNHNKKPKRKRDDEDNLAVSVYFSKLVGGYYMCIYYVHICIWLVVSTPLKNIRQLGWWNSQLNGKS